VPSTTMLSTSAIKEPSGGSVTFTATITSTATAITGNVSFYDGAVQIGQSPVANGQAQLSLASLTVGTHSISVKYSGDSQNNPSTSAQLNEVITGSLQFPITATAGTQTRTIIMNVLLE
jgi:Bacterial Ig-like domain (group 3)